MNISNIMTAPVVTVGLDDSLLDVKDIFDQSQIRHLIVVEENQLFGIVSERDLLRRISPHLLTHIYSTRDLASLNQRVHQIVTRKPLSLTIHSDAYAAVALFKSKKIGCIPIVNDDNRPVGIVTRSDILRHFDDICCAISPKGG